MSKSKKIGQLKGTARRPGSAQRLADALNRLEDLWKALTLLVDKFEDKNSAAEILLRMSAKVWVEAGLNLDDYRRNANDWVTRYDKIDEAKAKAVSHECVAVQDQGGAHPDKWSCVQCGREMSPPS